MDIAARAKTLLSISKEAFGDWQEDKASRLGAALAYYTIFSIAPLLLIVISMVGIFFGRESVEGEVMSQIQNMVGESGASAIKAMLMGASQTGQGIVSSIIGLVVLFFGASGVFAQLQDALDTVWEVRPSAERPFWTMIKDRWVSFTMVLGIGFLLLVSLVISAALSLLTNFIGQQLPIPGVVLQLLNLFVSLVVLTFLFAMIFKYLPNVEVRWRSVWTGAALTAVLFTIGKTLIGLYLGHSAVASTYGAAGSLVVILIWTYYSAQILLYGAEVTQVVARRNNDPIIPAKDFVSLPEEEKKRNRQQTPAQGRVDYQQPSRVHPQTGGPPMPAAKADKQEKRAQKDVANYLSREEQTARNAMLGIGKEVLKDSGQLLHPRALTRRFPAAAIGVAFASGLAASMLPEVFKKSPEAAKKKQAEERVRREQSRLDELEERLEQAEGKKSSTISSLLGVLITGGLKLAMGPGRGAVTSAIRSRADRDLKRDEQTRHGAHP